MTERQREIKWPENKESVEVDDYGSWNNSGDVFSHGVDVGYADGYNAAIDACRKAFDEAQTAGLVLLDRDKLYKVMKSVQAFEGDEFHECLEKILKTFGTQQSKLSPLKWQEIFDMIFDRTHYSVESANDIATEICLKYGAPAVPSVDNIEQVLVDSNLEHAQIRLRHEPVPLYFNYAAQAIHRLLTNGGKKCQ